VVRKNPHPQKRRVRHPTYSPPLQVEGKDSAKKVKRTGLKTRHYIGKNRRSKLRHYKEYGENEELHRLKPVLLSPG
jgi:hypothetical protein